MSVIAIVGAQWGDEGKGKIIDLMSENANVVVRFSGGDNAGHTVINPQGEFKLHLVPSGVFYAHTTCILGNGMAINPASLIEEIDQLLKHNIDLSRLLISDRAQVIMPYHITLDALEEKRRGKGAIGTTLKGIGPAFTDKIARTGIRMGDLLDPVYFMERLKAALELKNAIITKVYGGAAFSADVVFDQYRRYAERLAPMIMQTEIVVHDAIARRETVLLEGAQGAMLDPDFGTYPFATSSSPLSGGASTGAGVGAGAIEHVMGVTKAYTTRVGGGPMPTELTDATGDLIRNRAHEFGTTTGRPRRCGWLDAVPLHLSVQVNGLNSIALTRLDILDEFPALKICTGYDCEGHIIRHFPSSIAQLAKCKPVYEELAGWQAPTSGVQDFKHLPAAARKYIARIEELVECPVGLVSVGAGRDETIIRTPLPI